ncbi:CotH kinase family protein [Flavobacterium silvaticum]|uniref:T9SS type A sorting domain-containing protein n=1 Tax=Flavobacterium silvaticum TaxID=1852020 RepID=A0A972JJE1_9FLAO|nr:CotH kinase family protein [Flavobacterium silvaticum]NMH28122.1 T9SS type A sorting domain-containing protein [Flavobacterium silvaticum]
MKTTFVGFRSIFKILLLCGILFSGKISAQVFTDSNLPIVIINTDIDPNTGQPYEIPDDPRVLGNMKIIKHPDGSRNYLSDQDNAAFLNYNGRMNIEIRGATSQDLPKKQYGLTTLQADNSSNNNVSLLGMPSENDWVLNGLAFDPSLIRDYLSYNLSRLMGNYAPRTVYCEVVINGDYKGLYILQEKIKADSNRVNVVKITASDNTEPTISGGYITKADREDEDDPVAWIMPSYEWQTTYIHDLPKPEDVTAAQDDFIHDVFETLASTAHADNLSLDNGFPSVIDIPSFVDFMISSELASNVDSYQLSTYFHKDRKGKLRAGPIWDYNLTYGNDLFNYGLDRSHTDVWQFDNGDNTGSKFWKDLFDNETFKCYLSKRFHDLTQPGQPLKHSNLSTFIDQTVALITEASIRENERWGTVPDLITETENMKTWLYDRLNWMQENIGPYGNCTNVAVPSLVINRINYNPGTSGSFPVSNDQEFVEIKNAGNATVDLSGIYFSRLGLSYVFPFGATLNAGQSVFLASNTTTFQARYGFAAFGQFTRNLSNSSQKLVLSDAFGNLIDTVEYFDSSPWPDADGNGSYLQLIDTALDNNIASSWIATDTSLSTQDLVYSSVSVYPNPVRETLHLSSQFPISNIEIFNTMGRSVYTQKVNGQNLTFDATALLAGVYLLRIQSEQGIQTVRFVHQ